MEGKEREEEASLPPGYVSLAQLQERWLKKQQEKKANEKREKEERENGGRGKMGGGFVRRVEKNGGGMGVIDEKGKGKAIVTEGFGNGEVKKKNHRMSRNNRQKKSAGIEGKGEQVEREKGGIEVKELDSGNGEETGDDGLKGIKEIANVGIMEVLPRNGVKEGIADVKRVDFRGGFRRNGGDWGRRNEWKQREGRLGFGKKMEDGRGSGMKWEERRREEGDYQKTYNSSNGRRNGLFKGNEVEPVSEKKVEDGILEVFTEKCGLSEEEKNVNREKDMIRGDVVQGEGLSDDRVAVYKKVDDDSVAVKKKVDDEVLVVKSAEHGETGGVGNGYSRYGNWKNGRYRNWRGNDRDGRSYRMFERFEGRPRRKYGESRQIWVKKEEKSGAVAA